MDVAKVGVIVLAMLTQGAVNSCPQGWIKDELLPHRCFYYISNEAKFKDGQHACRHIGGEIAPASNQMHTASLAYFLQTDIPEQDRENVWLDMKYREGKWISSNGSAVHTSWYTGYPDGKGDCGEFLYSSAKMKNKKCKHKSAVACVGMKDRIDPINSSCPALPQAGITENAAPGTFGYLSCEQRYQLSANGHKKAFCRRNGTWSRTSAELATCQATACDSLRIGEAVHEVSTGGEQVGVRRNFTCPPGSSFRSKDSFSVTVECKTDGTWAKLSGESINRIGDCVVEATVPTAPATTTITVTTTTTTTITTRTTATAGTTPTIPTLESTVGTGSDSISFAAKTPMASNPTFLLMGITLLLYF